VALTGDGGSNTTVGIYGINDAAEVHAYVPMSPDIGLSNEILRGPTD